MNRRFKLNAIDILTEIQCTVRARYRVISKQSLDRSSYIEVPIAARATVIETASAPFEASGLNDHHTCGDACERGAESHPCLPN